MKLYIQNYNIKKLVNKLEILEKYKVQKNVLTEIYSDEGIYNINDINLYKLSTEDSDIIKINNYYNNYDILIDNSKITYVKTYQIPHNHIILHMMEFFYLATTKSSIKLVIICKCLFNETSNNQLDEFVPIDFYFEVSDKIDIHSELFKSDLNVFLSLLN